MALSGTDVLKLIVDADSSGAIREFDKLGKGIRSSVGDAEKATSGFKGALTKAFDGLQAKSGTVSGIFDKVGISSQQAAGAIATAIPAAGIAAAAGLAAFAVKGIAAFQETALAAGKFADSTGLSVDAASRYIAVADDIGVGASTIQGAFVKMEKAMASNRAAFGDLITTTKSGGVDLDQTFLNAITHLQGIKDPIERANESSKLFGKGFAEVSQILGTNADDLKAKLAGVSDAQIINPAELKKARDYQAAMDNLSDSVGDLSIQLGQSLVPALADAANKLAAFIQGAQNVNKKSGGLLGDLFTSFKDTISPVDGLRDHWNELQKAFGSNESTKKAAGDISALAGSAGSDAARITAGMKEAEQAIFGLQGPTGAAASDFERLTKASNAIVSSADMIPGSADAAANSIARTGSEMGDLAEASQKTKDAINNVHDALLNVNNTQLDTAKLTQNVVQAMTDANKVAEDSKSTALDQAVAFDDAAKSAIGLAENHRQLAKDTGATDQGQQAFIDTLKFISNSSAPEVKRRIDDVIASYENFGKQHPEATATANNTDAITKIDAAQQAANVFGRTVATAAIHADDQASGKLASVKRGVDDINRTVTVTVNANTATAARALNNIIRAENAVNGTNIALVPGGAQGFKNFKGGVAMVGEDGPELVILPKGADVIPNRESQRMIGGPTALPSPGKSSGNVVQITVNGAVDPYSTARQIQTILAKGGYAGFSAKAA